ncbi:universal stress protein [Herbaspirillum sp. RV1423]|uniref:universal stress protein n=1 Tax=Herbaspirillum sp. RV1423 TaxID=1443993 RepID=UPI0004B31D62|nr:universal stress protein [Herbaspirillum sp. RV1423]
MPYRSILVHVSSSHDLEQRVKVAARLASRDHATVIGLAVTGISRFLSGLPGEPGSALLSPTPPADGGHHDKLRQEMTMALERFEVLAQEYGVKTRQGLLVDDDAATALSNYGNAADLIILGRKELTHVEKKEESDFVEYVTLNAETPVFTVNQKPFLWKHALIAWNSSGAAARAARNAVPILQDMGQVSVVIFGSGAAPGSALTASEHDLKECLSSLPKNVTVIHRPAVDNIGQALLTLVDEIDADLLVMGCVAHPRWRGALLGGTTGVVLANAAISLFMSR